MRRRGCAPSISILMLILACTPSTQGQGEGEGETSGDGDGDEVGDGDGEPGDGDGEPGDGDGEPGDGDGEPGDGDGDEPCSELGCECDDSDGACNEGLECVEGVCMLASCGDAELDEGEQCDDGNRDGGDGCENDCTITEIQGLLAGGRHTCAVLEGGGLRCWGEGSLGMTGYGTGERVGDDEHPSEAGDVPLPSAVVSADGGVLHTCARFDDGELRCWGFNASGQLGYANTVALGDDETLEDLAGVEIGEEPFTQFSAGDAHNCGRFENGKVLCWGRNNDGQLGLGTTVTIGNDEHPAAGGTVELGANAVSVTAGSDHSCARTDNFQLRCWGKNNRGQLGYASSENRVGDDEHPAVFGDLDLYPAGLANDSMLAEVALGDEHSCARFSTGEVLCWGKNDKGQLGRGDTVDWGKGVDEHPAMLTPIDLGGATLAIAAGFDHTCALIAGGLVRCWGKNDKGQLGLGDPMIDNVGDDEVPGAVDPIDIGGLAVAIAVGSDHACALLDTNEIVCWGDNVDGRLGYANVTRIGDDEVPADAGTVQIF